MPPAPLSVVLAGVLALPAVALSPAGALPAAAMPITRAVAAAPSTGKVAVPLTVASRPALHRTGISAGTDGTGDTYWTPARMRTARSLDIQRTPAAAASAISVPARGIPGGVAAAGPVTSTAGTLPPTALGTPWPAAASPTPTRTTGRVFFLDDVGNAYSCSGSAVNAESGLVVVTAGHCVFNESYFCDGHTGNGYYRDWTYVPGYRNGTAPLGLWTARELGTPTGFCDGVLPGSLPYDTGVAVLNENAGRRLQDVTGANGIAWNQPTGADVVNLGYPAAGRFDGETLQYCAGSTAVDPPSGSTGMACDMSNGSSGGPWLRSYSDATGYGVLTGNTSFGYVSDPTRVYSPYYGTAQADLYNAVRHRYEPVHPTVTAPGDFSGDGRTDLTVFRPSNGTWYVRGVATVVYGAGGDIPVPADYNGDGRADMAVFRPATSTWYLRGIGTAAYGTAGDTPVPADYTGAGRADIGVFRPSNGTWYARGVATVAYGTRGDLPVPADYDGDGRADNAVFRPSNGTWYIRGMGNVAYGIAGDIPVPADYNGDGRADIGVFRPSNGTWYLRGIGALPYGVRGDLPLRGDYTGAGRDGLAIWRAGTGTFFVSHAGSTLWGTGTDVALPRFPGS